MLNLLIDKMFVQTAAINLNVLENFLTKELGEKVKLDSNPNIKYDGKLIIDNDNPEHYFNDSLNYKVYNLNKLYYQQKNVDVLPTDTVSKKELANIIDMLKSKDVDTKKLAIDFLYKQNIGLFFYLSIEKNFNIGIDLIFELNKIKYIDQFQNPTLYKQFGDEYINKAWLICFMNSLDYIGLMLLRLLRSDNELVNTL